MDLQCNQWHVNITIPRNRFQAFMARWLLGWETYYGETPPWKSEEIHDFRSVKDTQSSHEGSPA